MPTNMTERDEARNRLSQDFLYHGLFKWRHNKWVREMRYQLTSRVLGDSSLDDGRYVATDEVFAVFNQFVD